LAANSPSVVPSRLEAATNTRLEFYSGAVT
jgi:hypothetical protein